MATVTVLRWPGGGDNISITRISIKEGKKDGDFYKFAWGSTYCWPWRWKVKKVKQRALSVWACQTKARQEDINFLRVIR